MLPSVYEQFAILWFLDAEGNVPQYEAVQVPST